MGSELVFTPGERRLLMEARRAVLATIAPDGAARLVPICFAVHASDPIIWTPLDDKPKAIDDPRGLARARDVLADPRVTVLVAAHWMALRGSWLFTPGPSASRNARCSVVSWRSYGDKVLTTSRKRWHSPSSSIRAAIAALAARRA